MGSTDPRRVIETRHSVYSRIRWMGVCEWSVLFITCSNGTVLFIVKKVFFFIICLDRMIGFFICCFRFEVNITFMNRKDEWKILKFYSVCTITCKVIIVIVSIIMVNWKWSIKYTMNVFEIQLHARFHIFFFFSFDTHPLIKRQYNIESSCLQPEFHYVSFSGIPFWRFRDSTSRQLYLVDRNFLVLSLFQLSRCLFF